jgi:fumarylacetoacetate (FAA) hydrolase
MKLASYKHGRDGRLMIVSRDLSRCEPCRSASSLQQALDQWETVVDDLREQYEQLNRGNDGEVFSELKCASPLPRAFQWADGSAYVNHVALVRQARGAEMPPSFWHDPLMYQGGSDCFLGPRDDINFRDVAHGLDMEGEIAVITDDVPMGASRDEAARAIRLVMLVNDVSLRGLIPDELAKGFGFFQSKPASTFSPVAVTLDELPNWTAGKLHGALNVDLNHQPLGRANAGLDMTFDFPTLIAHAAATRVLAAGTIIGSGTVSNRGADGGAGKPVAEGGAGYSCLAELRMIETINTGSPKTPFMRDGDIVRIEMFDESGQSIFGTIEQRAVLS